MTTAPTLDVADVSKHFGGVPAASDVSLSVDRGQIVGLIGPNGAGKSTILNCLSGIDTPTSGRVALDGTDITRWAVHRRARRGMGRTFQLLRLFPTLSVSQNISVALESTVVTRFAGGPHTRRRVKRSEVGPRTEQALRRVGLAALADGRIDSLTAGQKRLIEIARLVAMDLDVLLLDEPAAGLNPAEGDELFAVIESLAREGKAVLLVEHRIRSVVRVADHLVVMDHGRVIAEGSPETVMEREVVREAYMGAEADARG